MKERPILFSAPMVRAILDGSKTQTRRVIKPEPMMVADHATVPWEGPAVILLQLLAQSGRNCPYGQPGDRLWVREAWTIGAHHDSTPPREIPQSQSIGYLANEHEGPWLGRKRPSIHMPRWASRILLEIVSVRVERLQDISETDAQAEGARRFDSIPMGFPSANPCRWSMESPTNTDQCLSTARWAFANYFAKVNGKMRRGVPDTSPWDANPWVWVVTFKRVPA